MVFIGWAPAYGVVCTECLFGWFYISSAMQIEQILNNHAEQLSTRFAVTLTPEQCRKVLARAMMAMCNDNKPIGHVYQDLIHGTMTPEDINRNAGFEAVEQFHAMWFEIRKQASLDQIQSHYETFKQYANTDGGSTVQ